MFRTIVLLGFGLSFAAPLGASPFDGLYRPSGPIGADWSCSANQIGMEGGALSIGDGYIDGVENRCKLTEETTSNGTTYYTADCSAEGEIYFDEFAISKTDTGVMILRKEVEIRWDSCAEVSSNSDSRTASNGRWTFGGGQGIFESSTSDDKGNSVTFTCNDLGGDGGLYIELAGRPIANGDVLIEVDGQELNMPVWARGGDINTECSACMSNYTTLWNATAAGNLMTIQSSDGQQATFSLNGSRDALGEIACRPPF